MEVFSPQVNITGPAARRATRSSALTNVSKSCIYWHLRVLIRWHSPVFRRQPNCGTAQRREGVARSLMAVASLATENPSQDKASIFGRYLSFFYMQEAAGAANSADHNETYMVTMTLPSDVRSTEHNQAVPLLRRTAGANVCRSRHVSALRDLSLSGSSEPSRQTTTKGVQN